MILPFNFRLKGNRYPAARVTDNRAQFALRWQDHQRAALGLPRQITNLEERP